MAFTKIQKKVGKGGTPNTELSLVNVSRNRLQIGLGPQLMGIMEWKRGDHIGVYVGEGKDDGTLLLVKDEEGYMLSRGGKSTENCKCYIRPIWRKPPVIRADLKLDEIDLEEYSDLGPCIRIQFQTAKPNTEQSKRRILRNANRVEV